MADAGAMSHYLAEKIINASLRGNDFTAPSTSDLHLALFTDDPTNEGDTDREVKDPWYSRKTASDWVSPSVDDEDRMRTYNGSSVTFDAVEEPDQDNDDYSGSFDSDDKYTIEITHVALFDASSSGNMLYHEELVTPKTLEVGDVISFAENALVFRLD
ncbi:MAG: phage tail fiber protein [Bacteroidota bacterium]